MEGYIQYSVRILFERVQVDMHRGGPFKIRAKLQEKIQGNGFVSDTSFYFIVKPVKLPLLAVTIFSLR